MSYPTDYNPTLKDPIPFYKSLEPTGDQSTISFGPSIGVSYIGPLMLIPSFWNDSNGNPVYWGLTQYPEIENKANLLKQLPPGLRGSRPFFVEKYDVNYFANESLADSQITSLRSLKGVTYISKNDQIRMDLENIRVTGYYGTPWPIAGVSAMSIFFKSYCQELAKLGATMDAFITDIEFVNFGHYIGAPILASMTGSTQYYQPYYGISSWNDLMNFYGSSASQVIPNVPSDGQQYYLYKQANWAWAKVAQKYVGNSIIQGYYNPAKEVYPNIFTTNYEWYVGENNREDEAIIADGGFWPQGGNQGRAGSPVLYGRIRQLSGDMSYGFCIKEGDSTRLWGWLTERRALYRRGPQVYTSPSLSFMQAMMELRTAKRNDYYNPVVPHINSIYTPGYGSEGHFKSLSFPIAQYQSPSEVLHDHWYPININGNLYSVGGITSYDGTTSAYLIRPSLSIVSETWYKQNIASITFDGATTAYQIRTSGITGTTAALAYYLNRGLTSGDTYVFSYFIDATRGFTGFNARFINWNTSDSISLAPSLTTTSGITFQQILPVTGPISYLQTPIQYNVGGSGWIKVAFEFRAPSATPRLGLHVYHAANNITQGYTAFIKDVFLNHKLNGRTESLTFIGDKNKNSSVEYYYKGLTPGLTYIFSYYTDLSRSYTGPDNIQTINHFQTPTYFLPLGITFNQVSPTNTFGNFNTGGISYGSATGWTKISYSFNIPVGNTYDPIFRDTFAASIYKFNNSVLEPNNLVLGVCMYIASPTLEIENTPSNISIPVAPVNFESITRWNYGPPVGWCDAQVGPNRRYNLYLVSRPGNSAYYNELIYHCCLNGSAKLGFFNVSDYVDLGLTGSISGGGSDVDGPKFTIYRNSGLTHHVKSSLVLDSVLKDVHSKIGGFTIASANVTRPDWLAPYIASGAPNTRGSTWWWRLTALPGYNVNCNGITLNSSGIVGTWVGTTGPSLSGVNITSTKLTELKPEPSIVSPSKEINFAGMTSLSQLVAQGFTFSRGSTGTYTDSTGKIVVVGPNIPRFEYDPDTLQPLGLLLEVAHTNLLNWSETFATSGGSQNNWRDTNLARTSGFTSPSGVTSAIRFTATGGNATLISTNPIGSSSFRSFSIFMRGVSGTENVFYTIDGGTSWTQISGVTQYYYDTGNQVTYTLRPLGSNISNSWKRFIFGPTTANHHVGIRLGNTGDSVEIWGAQVQTRTTTSYTQRAFATSYIPTTSTTATQAADSCFVTGTGFTSWYGQTYGSFVVKARNTLGSTVLDLFRDSNNNMGFQIGNLYAYVYGEINAQTNFRFTPTFTLTQEPIFGVDDKFIFTYGPRGIKFGGYAPNGPYEDGYNNIRSVNWAGNTIGPPEITRLGFTPDDNLIVKNIRYWPFVFDESTMVAMSQGGIDPSVGYFGVYG